VIFTPGHTPGSVSILTDDHQAIVGDLCGGGWLLGQFQPGRPRYHYWASSVEDVQASLKRVFASQPSQIHVGHGEPLDGRKAGQFFLGPQRRCLMGIFFRNPFHPARFCPPALRRASPTLF
jgi:glyoxylase-like metal-dependent hydrolase (beta-lactamase superfamily II)